MDRQTGGEKDKVIPVIPVQLGPWTARPVADNSARKKRTTRPVAESSACTFKYSLHFLSCFLLMLDETFLF